MTQAPSIFPSDPHTVPQYVLSRDPRLEVHWIYRVESHADGHITLHNALNPNAGTPVVSIQALTEYDLVALTLAQYEQLETWYSRANDADLCQAQALIAQILTLRSDPDTVTLRNVWLDTDLQATASALPPFGPGFAASDIQQATRLEYWATTFAPPGEDWIEFRLWRDDTILRTYRMAGY